MLLPGESSKRTDTFDASLHGTKPRLGDKSHGLLVMERETGLVHNGRQTSGARPHPHDGA